MKGIIFWFLASGQFALANSVNTHALGAIQKHYAEEEKVEITQEFIESLHAGATKNANLDAAKHEVAKNPILSREYRDEILKLAKEKLGKARGSVFAGAFNQPDDHIFWRGDKGIERFTKELEKKDAVTKAKLKDSSIRTAYSAALELRDKARFHVYKNREKSDEKLLRQLAAEGIVLLKRLELTQVFKGDPRMNIETQEKWSRIAADAIVDMNATFNLIRRDAKDYVAIVSAVRKFSDDHRPRTSPLLR